jgi:hypothetical protein
MVPVRCKQDNSSEATLSALKVHYFEGKSKLYLYNSPNVMRNGIKASRVIEKVVKVHKSKSRSTGTGFYVILEDIFAVAKPICTLSLWFHSSIRFHP